MVRHAGVLATVVLFWSVPAFAEGTGHHHATPTDKSGHGAVTEHHDDKARSHGQQEQTGHVKDQHKDQDHHGNGHDGDHGKGGHAEPRASGSPLEQQGRELVVKLHCNACHLVSEGIQHEHHGGHQAIAPDLSFEGDKVRPEWLFDFLKGPHRLRPSINSRMPNFLLSDREALALTEHIAADLRDKTPPPLPGRYLAQSLGGDANVGVRLVSEDYLDCFSCHQLGDRKPRGEPEEWAPDLTLARSRLRPEWIVRWLIDPQRIQPGTKMPTYFSDGHSGPDDILGGNEERQIIALRDYLLGLGPETNSPRYAEAKKRYPNVTTGDGWALMQELNCAGCHDVGRMHERQEIAPPLAHEGSRVYGDWLAAFLLRPTRIRPVGYVVGSPARMPDFRLSRHEAEAITAFLMSQKMPEMAPWWARSSAPALVDKGRALYKTWNCASCHRGAGPSRSGPTAVKFEGPDLSRVGRRLRPDHLLFWFRGSSGTVDTHPMIPTLGLRDDELKALVAYLTTLR